MAVILCEDSLTKHSFSCAHMIFLSWCLPTREANNSWPEKICRWMQTTESVLQNSPICLGLFGLSWPHFYSFYKRDLNWYFPCKWKCYVTIYYSINIHIYVHRGQKEQMIKPRIRFTIPSCMPIGMPSHSRSYLDLLWYILTFQLMRASSVGKLYARHHCCKA